MYLSAANELILGFKAPFKLSGGNNWVEICFKYCTLILSRNTDNQSLVWKLWITKCTRANGNFIGSEINMKGQAYRWPCGGWMAVTEERQPAPFFNYPMHLLKEESQLPKYKPATSGAEPKGMGWGCWEKSSWWPLPGDNYIKSTGAVALHLRRKACWHYVFL